MRNASPISEKNMDNFIIIGIITVIVAVGIYYTVKHFKGEGGCCGGGSFKPKKKEAEEHQIYKGLPRWRHALRALQGTC